MFYLWSGNLRFDHSRSGQQGSYCPCIEERGAARFQDGAYHHIVASYDTITMRVYADGEEVARAACSTALPDTSATLELGRYVHGCIDEVAIYDRALPEPAIKRHFAARVSR